MRGGRARAGRLWEMVVDGVRAVRARKAERVRRRDVAMALSARGVGGGERRGGCGVVWAGWALWATLGDVALLVGVVGLLLLLMLYL